MISKYLSPLQTKLGATQPQKKDALPITAYQRVYLMASLILF